VPEEPIPQEGLEEPGEPLGQEEPAAPQTPQAAPAGVVDENERKTWEGRVRAEQAKFDVLDAQLAPQGYKVDRENGQIVPIPGYAPQSPAEPEDDYDPYDKAAVQKMIRDGIQAGINELMPVIDATVDTAVGTSIADWNDIKAGVLERARSMGFSSLTELRKRPDVFDLFVDAERGKRGSVPASPAAPSTTDASREELIAAGATVGGGGSTTVSPSEYQLDAEERDYIKRNKLTEAQYIEQISGPAKIKIGGQK
jgi:hypothetical protein